MDRSAEVADGTMSTEKIIRLLIVRRDKSIGNNVVDSNLP